MATPERAAAGAHRFAAAVVAFAVFVLAGAFAWSALRPVQEDGPGSGEPPHRTMAVLEPSGGMLPTLEVGQAVVVDLDAYDIAGPERGDIIAFTVPAYPDQLFLKRVIGLPGETVAEVDGVVRVNGVPLHEPYTVKDGRTLGPWVVEAGHVFVMGDNRPNSNDSRFSAGIGQVAFADIAGRVLPGVTPTDEPAAPNPPGTASTPA
jgi:signal peptidase I